MSESDRLGLECSRVWAEIDLGAIAFNVRQLKRLLGDKTEIMAVVKADGYSHGAEQVSRRWLWRMEQHGWVWHNR